MAATIDALKAPHSKLAREIAGLMRLRNRQHQRPSDHGDRAQVSLASWPPPR